MPEYRVIITLDVDRKDAAMLVREGYKFCLAFGFEEIIDDFTVVAFAEHVRSERFAFTWTDDYKIAATKDRHAPGIRPKIEMKPSSIKSQQSYTLPQNWSDGQVEDDGSLPEGHFAFVNNTQQAASAVVFQTIRNASRDTSVPVYVCRQPAPWDGGMYTLRPNRLIALWVEKRVEAGNMISGPGSHYNIFDMTGKTTLQVKWSIKDEGFVAQ